MSPSTWDTKFTLSQSGWGCIDGEPLQTPQLTTGKGVDLSSWKLLIIVDWNGVLYLSMVGDSHWLQSIQKSILVGQNSGAMQSCPLSKPDLAAQVLLATSLSSTALGNYRNRMDLAFIFFLWFMVFANLIYNHSAPRVWSQGGSRTTGNKERGEDQSARTSKAEISHG